MLKDHHPVVQALLGTLLTWGLTAAGSALVFVFQSGQVSDILLNPVTVSQIKCLLIDFKLVKY